MDTQSSGDESVENEANLKLLPLKQGKPTQDPHPSSSKSTDPNPTIEVPEGERDFSKRIEQFLGADRTPLSDSFDTDLEGDSARTSLALSDDDWGHPSDKGLLLKTGGEEAKGFNWRALFRLHSWWNVAAFLIIAIIVVWLSIRGLPWSSTGAAISETVSAPYSAILCHCNVSNDYVYSKRFPGTLLPSAEQARNGRKAMSRRRKWSDGCLFLKR
jgi:beta-glucosidase